MNSTKHDDQFAEVQTLTFDCYGTLVDWRAGLEKSLLALFGAALMPRMAEVFTAYLETEKEVEAQALADGFRSYRLILAETAIRLGDRLALPISMQAAEQLPEMLGDWPAYEDTVEALRRLKSRYRLGILSNIDRDLFARTARKLDVAFDFIITAQDVTSYKPGHAHFQAMLEQEGGPENVLHVAQSLYHDGQPANELGLAYVWINRYKDTDDLGVKKVAEYPDLRSLADAMGV